MLKKQHRLRKTNEFKRAFRGGKGYEENGVFVKARATGETFARIGVIVSKKVTNKAVKRNRIRRMIMEAVREMLPDLKSDQDIVLVIRPDFAATKTTETLEIVREIFKKASLFKR